ETNERSKAQKVPLPFDVAQIKVDRVTQRLEGEKGYADGQQVFEAKWHQGGRVRQAEGPVKRSEQRVQILHDETGIFKKEQQRQVVDQTNQEPNAAAAPERAQGHQ